MMSGDDEDYGEEDFDDYEFEDFEDSADEEDEDADINDKKLNDSAYDQNEGINTICSREDNNNGLVDHQQDNLDSTDDHNQQIISNLKLDEPADFAQTDRNSAPVVPDIDNDNTKSYHDQKDIGENTLVQSISTELRQMMLDEKRHNKENLRSASPAGSPETSRGRNRAVVENSSSGKKKNKHKTKLVNSSNKSNDRVKAPASFSSLLPGEEGLLDNSSWLVDGVVTTFPHNTSSVAQSNAAPSHRTITGPGSELWKSQLDSYSATLVKCVENETKRNKGSRFIQSHVSHDAKHHRSIVEKQLSCALQQVHSYRKENSHLIKMIDGSTIHAEFNALRATNEEQRQVIKQLTDENRALLLVQRNQEKSLLDTEKDKECLPEQEFINQKKMNLFQKKVKTLRDNLYTYQVKAREEMEKNAVLRDQLTKLKVKHKALVIQSAVAEQVRRDSLGLVGHDREEEGHALSCNQQFESVGVGDEAEKQGDSSAECSGKQETLEEVRSQRNRLKSIVENQRSSFRSQLVVVQTKLDASLCKRKELEDELLRREKEMRSQIYAVKELNKTCAELTKSNLELLEASALYSKKVRRTVGGEEKVVPRPPSQAFAARPSPVTARPKEPMMANDNTFLTGHNFED